MLKSLIFSIFLVVVGIVSNPVPVSASPILSGFWDSDAECGGDCHGATYQLVIDDGGTNDNNFTATMTINAAGFDGTGTRISAVDFKVSNNALSASITAAPGVDGNWTTVVNAGQANGKCTGSGKGFITSCDFAPVNEAVVPNATPLVWSWNFSLPVGDDNGDIVFGHLGVNYDNVDSTQTGGQISISTLVSNGPGPGPVTEVPESASLILLGSGLLLTVVAKRRFSNRSK
jgi:hypothetical protein